MMHSRSRIRSKAPGAFRQLAPLLLIGCVLACEPNRQPQEQPAKRPAALPVGKIVYRIEVLSGETVQSTITRTVYFDGRRSAVYEYTNDHGFPGETILFANAGDSMETYVKSLPYVTFRLERARTGSDPGPAIVQQDLGTKTINGRRIGKRVLEADLLRYTAWYTPDSAVNDPTFAVVQSPHVPGLIRELDKELKGRSGWHTKTVLVAFDPDSQERSKLAIPKDAVKVADADEALARSRELFEQAMQRERPLTWQQQQQFVGKWQTDRNGTTIAVRIEKFGDAYTFMETHVEGGKRTATIRGMARFYGSRLLLEQGSAYRTLFFDANGELRSDQEPDRSWKKVAGK